MIEEASKNKMMDGETSKTKGESLYKDVTIKAVSLNVNEYHFPGAPDFAPMSVKATSIEEAEQLWKTQRKPVTPETVEEVKKETKNDE